MIRRKKRQNKNLGKTLINVNYYIICSRTGLQLTLLNRYGGWYSDLDTIFLRPLTALKNVIGSADLPMNLYDDPRSIFGRTVSSAILHLTPNHMYSTLGLELFSAVLSQNRNLAKSFNVFQQSLDILCGRGSQQTIRPRIHNRRNCDGIAVVEPRVFYPFPIHNSQEYDLKKTAEEWKKIFRLSFTVQLLGCFGRPSSNTKILWPRFYGAEKPAMVYLGNEHCPISYFSERLLK